MVSGSSSPTRSAAATTRNFAIIDLKANTGRRCAVISAVPDKVLAIDAGRRRASLALSGAASTDPDTNPTQPLTYAWEQVDPATGDPVPRRTRRPGHLLDPELGQHHVDRAFDGSVHGAGSA